MEVKAVEAFLVIGADVEEELEGRRKELFTASAVAPGLRNKLGPQQTEVSWPWSPQNRGQTGCPHAVGLQHFLPVLKHRHLVEPCGAP